jgi:hypothetical protein
MVGPWQPLRSLGSSSREPQEAGRTFCGKTLPREFWNSPTPAPPMFSVPPSGGPPSHLVAEPMSRL